MINLIEHPIFYRRYYCMLFGDEMRTTQRWKVL